MNKSPVAFVAALLAAAVMLTSSAEAGFGIRLGFGGAALPLFVPHGGGYSGERHYERPSYVERRAKKEKTEVAKHKTSSERKVAKKEVEHKVAKQEASEPKVTKKAEVKVAQKEKSSPKRETVASAPAEADAAANSENSSITTAALESTSNATDEPSTVTSTSVQPAVAEAPLPEAKPTKSASKLDCKKFFPSVGMTLTVPCE